MENNGGEQDPIGNQEEMADFEDWMYEYLEMESNNSGEQGPIDNQVEMAAPQGETDEPDVAHGDNVQPGENDQVPVETGSGIFELGLHGPIPRKTYRSKRRLAEAFGFPDIAALKTWMKSEAFWPYYSGLEANLETIGADGSVFPKVTPQFVTVVLAVSQEEDLGAKRYSRFHDIGKFDPTDWYAVFLVHAVKHNFFTPTGAFFGKNMTLEDMQKRMWQALLLARRDDYNDFRYRTSLLLEEASSSIVTEGA